MNRRIVITGMGVISSIGQSVAEFRQNLFAGKSGIDTLTFPYSGNPAKFPAAPVRDFTPENWIDPKKLPLQDRFAQFAVAAALDALKDSGLNLAPEMAERTAVITGTGVGGQTTIEESYYKFLAPGSSQRTTTTLYPAIAAEAGFVPWADDGMRQMSRCPCPRLW